MRNPDQQELVANSPRDLVAEVVVVVVVVVDLLTTVVVIEAKTVLSADC